MIKLFSELKRSVSVKAAIVGFLVLLLLIPLAMIRDTIVSREVTSLQAEQDIMESWGHRQTIAGPILVVPYNIMKVKQTGETYMLSSQVHFLPENLDVDVSLVTEERHRGIFEVPVYTAATKVKARFAPPDTSNMGLDQAVFQWQRAYIAMSIFDPKAARQAPTLKIGDAQTRFQPAGSLIAHLPPQLASETDYYKDPANRAEPLDVEIGFELSGTKGFHLHALGNETAMRMRADWPDPSFTGDYLPESHTITDEGFEAEWRATSLGRILPGRWNDGSLRRENFNDGFLGVELYTPVGPYTLTDRATKYGVLFIGLSFVAYFLFEILAGLRLHPLQYLLVGFGNATFYLLLLSFAEHIGFGAAYFLSSLASAGMIAGYSYATLKTRRRAAIMLGILSALYLFLYLTLNAETYAMLAGSIGLWAALAAIMYLTRRIDWYNIGKEANGQEEMAI